MSKRGTVINLPIYNRHIHGQKLRTSYPEYGCHCAKNQWLELNRTYTFTQIYTQKIISYHLFGIYLTIYDNLELVIVDHAQ